MRLLAFLQLIIRKAINLTDYKIIVNRISDYLKSKGHDDAWKIVGYGGLHPTKSHMGITEKQTELHLKKTVNLKPGLRFMIPQGQGCQTNPPTV